MLFKCQSISQLKKSFVLICQLLKETIKIQFNHLGTDSLLIPWLIVFESLFLIQQSSMPEKANCMCNWTSHRLNHQIFDDINRGELLERRHAVTWSMHTGAVWAFAAFPVRFAHTAVLVVYISVHRVWASLWKRGRTASKKRQRGHKRDIQHVGKQSIF